MSAPVRAARRPRAEWEQIILTRARDTLAREGFGVSINQLIEETGAPVGTFYRIFADKDALFARIMSDLHPGYLERLRAGLDDIADPVERLRETIERFVVVGVREYGDVARNYFRDVRGRGNARAVAEAVEADEVALLTEPIRAGIASGVMTCPYPDLAGRSILGLIRRTTEVCLEGGDTASVEDAAAMVASLVVTGVCRS